MENPSVKNHGRPNNMYRLFSILFSTLFSVAVHTQAAAKKCVYVYLKMTKPLFFFQIKD